MNAITQPTLVSNNTDYCNGIYQTDSSFCGMFGIRRVTIEFLGIPHDTDVIP